MKSDSCQSVRRHLAWFVGGDLDRYQAAPVAKHLAECLECRREASSLQQSHKALSSLRDGGGAIDADAEMFASLHRDTLAAVGRHIAAAGNRPPGLSPVARGLWVAAAGMLFGLGWWSVREPEAPTLLDRDPIPAATPASTNFTAVPWAGPRAHLTPLGFDERGERSEDELPGDGARSGMLWRWNLRTLEEELDGPPLRRSGR